MHCRQEEEEDEARQYTSQKKHMHNLINRRRTSRINELINALADKVPQLNEGGLSPAERRQGESLGLNKDQRSKAAILQGATPSPCPAFWCVRHQSLQEVIPNSRRRGAMKGGAGAIAGMALGPIDRGQSPAIAPALADVLSYVETLQRHCKEKGVELPTTLPPPSSVLVSNGHPPHPPQPSQSAHPPRPSQSPHPPHPPHPPPHRVDAPSELKQHIQPPPTSMPTAESRTQPLPAHPTPPAHTEAPPRPP